MKNLIIILGILGAIVVLTVILFLIRIPNFEPQITKVELRSEHYNESLFIKKKIWGITADHQVIIITKSNDAVVEPKIEYDYVYEGMLPFYYQFKDDTLKLFVRKESNIPNKLSTNIKIVQIILNNTEMMNLTKTYIEKNLTTL